MNFLFISSLPIGPKLSQGTPSFQPVSPAVEPFGSSNSAPSASPSFQAPLTQDYHQNPSSQGLHRPLSTSVLFSGMGCPEPRIVSQSSRHQIPIPMATNSKLEELLLGLKETRNNGFDISWSESDSRSLIAEVLAEPATSALVSAILNGPGRI